MDEMIASRDSDIEKEKAPTFADRADHAALMSLNPLMLPAIGSVQFTFSGILENRTDNNSNADSAYILLIRPIYAECYTGDDTDAPTSRACARRC